MKGLIITLLIGVGLQAYSQKRSVFIEEEWEDPQEYPYSLKGEFSAVNVVIKEGEDSRWLYKYELNEHSEPLRLRTYHDEYGTLEADYMYTYLPGEEVHIAKRRLSGIVDYQWKLAYNEITEESYYVEGDLTYTWKYSRPTVQERIITKHKSNGKLIYTWHDDLDHQGRTKVSYRRNGKKITQLLMYEYNDSLRTKTSYYFDKKALSSLEIGLSLDRDSIIKMEPGEIAARYYRPIPILIQGYTVDGRLRKNKLKSQMGQVVINDNYMYDRDGKLIEKKLVGHQGIPDNHKYYYGDDGKLKSVVRTISLPDRMIEQTHIYYYTEAGNYERIEFSSTGADQKPYAIHFSYTER